MYAPLSTHVANSIVALSAKLVALSAKRVELSAKLVQSEEHICNYRRDSPCVALRVAVEANELVHLAGGLSHPSNDDDCLPAWDGRKRPKIESSECTFWRLCCLCLKNNI